MIDLLYLISVSSEAVLHLFLSQPTRNFLFSIQMQSLQGGTEAIARLDQLEADYYDLQLQLYEVQFEILKCEELLLTAQLESIKRLISGRACT